MSSSSGSGFMRKRRQYLPYFGLLFLAVAVVKIGLFVLTTRGVVSLETARLLVTVAWLLLSGLGVASYALGNRRQRQPDSRVVKPIIETGPLYGSPD